METKDILQLAAISLTFLMGVVNLVYSVTEARKARRAGVVSERRRARMEQFATLFARMEALAHPDTILHAAGRGETPYHVSVTESCSALKMLLDHRYERDAELARQVMAVAERAVGFYNACASGGNCAHARRQYEPLYRESIQRLEMLMNVYMGAEWSRLQLESETGKKVSFEKWENIYNDGMEHYKKWNGE